MFLSGGTYFAKFYQDFVSKRHHISAGKYNPNLLYWTDALKFFRLQDARCLCYSFSEKRRNSCLLDSQKGSLQNRQNGTFLNSHNMRLSEQPQQEAFLTAVTASFLDSQNIRISEQPEKEAICTSRTDIFLNSQTRKHCHNSKLAF
jgi:hypothetical protein